MKHQRNDETLYDMRAKTRRQGIILFKLSGKVHVWRLEFFTALYKSVQKCPKY